MRAAFLYGQWSVGSRPFSLQSLWDDRRGLTGSEVSYFSYAAEAARRGHDVTLFLPQADAASWQGLEVRDVSSFPRESRGYDAAMAWNEPDLFRGCSAGLRRIVNQQLNDFDYCLPGYDSFVDCYTSPSSAHMEFMSRTAPSPGKWTVLPNGVASSGPLAFRPLPKAPGRVVYASSPDRGLHQLLRCWPLIRRSVPHAHLRILYNFGPWLDSVSGLSSHPHPDIRESAHRACYVREALRRLDGHGVEVVDSVSRSGVVRELGEAEVLAYPCDTIRYTEGFSVTLMEACASGALPVTTDADSLGSIYGGWVPMVKSPVGDRLSEYAGLVVRALTDPHWRREQAEHASVLASRHSWEVLGSVLESVLSGAVG